MAARRRGHARIAPAGMAAAAAIGWAYLHQPMHAAGLIAFEAPAGLLGIMMPGILASVEALPLLLVPGRVRIWHRRRREGRPAIPARLRRAVLAADGYRCCWCGQEDGLQLDHVRPWSRGGLTALWNMVTLCGLCNKVKSNYWVARDGFVFYRPFPGHDNRTVAAQILAYERVHRWNPLRWIRAGWSLGSLLCNTTFLAKVVLARERQRKGHMMSGRTRRTLVATAPDGTEVTRQTSGTYDTAGLIQKADGTWLIAAQGWSRESVYNRTHAKYNKGDYRAMHVSDLIEVTAPVIRKYFGTHSARVTAYFSGGQWRKVLSPDGVPCSRPAGRSYLRRLLREGVEALAISHGGRNADFQATEILKSMSKAK